MTTTTTTPAMAMATATTTQATTTTTMAKITTKKDTTNIRTVLSRVGSKICWNLPAGEEVASLSVSSRTTKTMSGHLTD